MIKAIINYLFDRLAMLYQYFVPVDAYVPDPNYKTSNYFEITKEGEDRFVLTLMKQDMYSFYGTDIAAGSRKAVLGVMELYPEITKRVLITNSNRIEYNR